MSNGSLHIKNHYVSEGYLKRWADAAGKVAVYRTLVASENVRQWSRKSTGTIAYHKHLYTRLTAAGEDDSVERWLDCDFEAPAQEPMGKAVSGRRLDPDDWRMLIRFIAAQDVRTPKRLRWSLKHAEEYFPTTMQRSIESSVRKLENRDPEMDAPPKPAVKPQVGNLPFRVSVEPHVAASGGTLKAEFLIGRTTWLFMIDRLLTQTLKVLYRHRWTILHPPPGVTFFTTDAPVLRVNYNSLEDYHFDGGWGHPGTEIMMPLGPEHLMYTQVARPVPPRGSRLQKDHASLIRRFMAEHADRFVYARNPDPVVQQDRPRVVDPNRFQREKEQWRGWHEEQGQAEAEFQRPGNA